MPIVKHFNRTEWNAFQYTEPYPVHNTIPWFHSPHKQSNIYRGEFQIKAHRIEDWTQKSGTSDHSVLHDPSSRS